MIKGITNPSIAKIVAPAIPSGITKSQFGRELIGWGSGPQGALTRIESINGGVVGQMQAQGLTRDMAIQWRNFYANEFSRNANNVTAQNRAQLMDRIFELMR
ncbi:DUF4951 domain-containing protein [Acidovorax sp. SUPP3334]|uniref:DUF4951 domain-containing protein n=1 Tax=Acidovorax sp. SUPP3334 TaxID=2920881 RepID=UPI0023DE2C80|nr:DUF4951 domain-containing protein [Acidovorax sp. SUPP3334]GKT21013.1 hypothetical protein AVHM3334_03215 [Acidovorax sp. SUPP3334]